MKHVPEADQNPAPAARSGAHPASRPDPYIVDAVTCALDVLDAFQGAGELGLEDIRRATGLTKSRSFRLLHTLAARGYVEKSTDGARYRLGIRICERAAQVRRDLRRVALDVMRPLSQRFNESVNLGVLQGGEVLYLDILESSRPFRMAASVGSRMPVESTALGKVIAAHLPAEECAALPCSSPETFRRELQLARRRGYALDPEENEPGVSCIGAALLDPSGYPVGAISISGPTHRMSAQRREMAEALLDACDAAALRLGGDGERPSKQGHRQGSRYSSHNGAAPGAAGRRLHD